MKERINPYASVKRLGSLLSFNLFIKHIISEQFHSTKTQVRKRYLLYVSLFQELILTFPHMPLLTSEVKVLPH